MIGEKVGKYEIEKLIGAGGMGEVYMARDTLLNRTVAIKFLPREVESRERVVKRFLREAQATARLTHPNIATVYGIEQHEGRYFILMEYIEGDSLSLLMRRGRLNIRVALNYGLQIAQALAEAHEHGVLHRDVKPSNILITRKQQVKVLDFGLAKFIDPDSPAPPSRSKSGRNTDDLTREGVLVGTPRYMAPEQILGKHVDVRSDIFAFGIILYEMFSGQHPFKGANSTQLVVAVTTEEPPAIRSLNPEVPEELVTVVMKALAKAPEARYQRVSELYEELRMLAVRLYNENNFDLSDLSTATSPSPRLSASTTHRDAKKTMAPPEPETTIDVVGNRETVPSRGSAVRIRSRLLALPIIVLLLIIIGISGYWLFAERVPHTPAATRPLIAVMYFDDLTNDPKLDWLSRGLTEMLTTNLAQVRSVEVVSKQRLFDTLQVLGKHEAKSIDRGTASQVAQKVGAGAVLSGSILKINARLRLNITLEDVESGKIIFSDVIDGNNIDEIFSLVDTVTAKISRLYNKANTTTEQPKLGQVTTTSVEAFRLYTRGMERCWLTHFDEGLDDLERAVQIDEQFAIAYLQIGNAKSVLKDFQGARDAIEKALQYIDRAGYREQLLIRGVSAYFQGYDSGDYRAALEIFNQMEANYPNDKEVHLWKGLTLWRSSDYKKAVQSYNRILELDPDFNQIYLMIAYAQADDEDYLSAIATLNHSLALFPGQPENRNFLGNIYARMAKYDNALNEYKAMLEGKKEYRGYRVYLDLAQVYFIKNELAKGQDAIEKYLKLTNDPVGRVWAYLMLFRQAFSYGRAQEAQRHLDDALSFAEKAHNSSLVTIVLCYRSDFYLFLGRKEDAVDSAREAISSAGLDVGGREASQQLALTLLEGGDKQAALASLESYFFKRTGGNRESLAEIKRVINGAIAYREANYAESLQLWSTPLKYNIRLYWRMGLAAFQAGNLSDAATHFTRLIEHEGFDPEQRGIYWSYQNPEYGVVLGHYYLGRIEEKLGKREEARKHYQQFLAHWGNADFTRDEIIDAKARLKAL
ncbi:MAG: protein kinase [Acidobacteriota bacterium]